MRRLAGGPRGKRTDGCPPAAEWAALAAGLSGARGAELLAHASQCDACGASLHAMVVDFSDELTESEVDLLATLESAQPDWQHRMARRMAQESGRGRLIAMPVRSWLARAAAVIVVMGTSWLGWDLWQIGRPARLIATAYTQQRPFDLRIPGAGYAEVRPLLRGPSSSFQKSAALLEAEAAIARELEKNPAGVKWLALRARAEMLEWDAETAVATLERARQLRPADADLLADLGMAYALRAEAQSRAADYKSALEYLGRAVDARPQFPEAVFNRALVYERMSLYKDAASEWSRYLELDKTGPWHEEAQRRLRELDAKKTR